MCCFPFLRIKVWRVSLRHSIFYLFYDTFFKYVDEIFEVKVNIIKNTFAMSVLANRHEMAFFRIDDQNFFIEPVI